MYSFCMDCSAPFPRPRSRETVDLGFAGACSEQTCPRESQVYVTTSQPIMLSDAMNLFVQSMIGVKAPKTVDWYIRRLPSLLEYLGDVLIGSIRIEGLRNWYATLSSRTERYTRHPYRHHPQPGGLSPYTLHQYVRAVRRFFKWLTVEGYLEKNPAERLEFPRLPKKRPRGISADNRDRIINAATHPRDLAMLFVLADTACRVGGLVGLDVDDVDLSGGVAWVSEKGGGGNGNERSVFITGPTISALRKWLKLRKTLAAPGCKALFVSIWPGRNNPAGSRLTENGAYEVLKRIAKRAGVERGYNPHNWRHGSIRGMLANGMPLPDVSQIAGHSSVQVTGDIYGIVPDEELRRKHQKYSWVNSIKIEKRGHE